MVDDAYASLGQCRRLHHSIEDENVKSITGETPRCRSHLHGERCTKCGWIGRISATVEAMDKIEILNRHNCKVGVIGSGRNWEHNGVSLVYISSLAQFARISFIHQHGGHFHLCVALGSHYR